MRDERLKDFRILIVDDEEANVFLLGQMLELEGYSHVRGETDPRVVIEVFDEFRPDLILLDLRMPHLSGHSVLEQLRAHVPEHEYLPVLVLTADVTEEAKQRALGAGARDFLSKPFRPAEALLRIENLLETRSLHLELRRQNERLDEQVRERTASLSEAVERLVESEGAIRLATEETIRKLAAAAELRDQETGRHIERVSRYTSFLAYRLGHDSETCEMLRLASSLHDVGKIGCPDFILRKRGPLTPEEFAVMKEHPSIGHGILSPSKAGLLDVAASIALTHHERVDGSGYPRGLSGADIPLEGRIVAVADVFDALTTERVYRRAFAVGEAVEMMTRERNRHFDAEALDAFLDGLDEVLRIREQFPEPA